MIRRVWVFARVPTTSSRSLFLDSVWNLNITDVAFMMNDIRDGAIRPLGWKGTAVERLALDLHEMDVTTHLVTWLWPDAINLRAAAAQFGPLCASLQSSVGGSLLFDAENTWRSRLQAMARAGRVSVLEAARRALEAWEFDEWRLRLGVSGPARIGLPYPDGSLPAARAALVPLIERCNYVLPQAYQLTAGGGNQQQRAHMLWRDFRRPIVMGLTANPAVIGTVARMRAAVSAVEALRDPVVPEVSYWHLQRFIASNTARFAFVQELAILARQARSSTAAAG